MIEIKRIEDHEITPDMLSAFHHDQVITTKYVFQNGSWKKIPTHELRTWNSEKRIWITEYLRQQIRRGGSVLVAFCSDIPVGFACIDGFLCGTTARYANLTMLFVDDAFQRKGIGTILFQEICSCARELGADKLFISAISSVETVAFYFHMGCTDAKEYISSYVDTEYDRFLEYSL